MTLLRSHLNGELSARDRSTLTEIIAQGIKTDASLVLDPNTVVAKTNGRVSKAVIESLLNRVILPAMLNSIPKPVRASEIYLEANSRGLPSYLTTGWTGVDELIGGKGWVSGEVSEICGPSGSGKTQLCLNTMVALLMEEKSARVLWIDTLDSGFSAQRASDVIRAHIVLRKQKAALEKGHSEEAAQEETTVEDRVIEVLSRIQVYACTDIYNVISIAESIRLDLEKSMLSTSLVVIDSLGHVLSSLLTGTHGVGHAAMMHVSRELRRLAQDFNLVVLVTTMSVLLVNPEEQSPSILMTSDAKPGLGTSWRYATDLQLYLTRLDSGRRKRPAEETPSISNAQPKLESDLFGDESGEAEDLHKDGLGGLELDMSRAPTRVAEIMKSRRLKIGEWCLFDLQP